MALQGWDKNYREQLKIQQQEIESLQQQLMIGEKRPDSPQRPPGGPPWPGYPNPMPPGKDWPTMAHGEGRGPQPKYHDEYNRPLNIPPWMHTDPSGQPLEVPWQKEQYKNEHPELMISDHRGLTNYLDSQGRSGRTGSFKDSGLSQEKLIEALKIGLQVMKA